MMTGSIAAGKIKHMCGWKNPKKEKPEDGVGYFVCDESGPGVGYFEGGQWFDASTGEAMPRPPKAFMRPCVPGWVEGPRLKLVK